MPEDLDLIKPDETGSLTRATTLERELHPVPEADRRVRGPGLFRNVVVGVDRASGGRDAIALSRRLLPEGGRLTLAHVYGGDPRLVRDAGENRERAQRERSLKVLQGAADAAGVQAELSSIESSSPGRGLHELCEAVRADLVVVGSSHRGLLGRVLLGDDTRAALNGAPCAIAIAPTGYAEHAAPIRRVGVGYNDSRESRHALAVARTIAGQHAAKLSALEVVSLPAYAFLGGPVPVDDTVEELIDDARRRIAALGGVDARAAYGSPVEDLTSYSGSLDLLILGSRDYGPVGRLVHGSTSQQLARTARCPLLVLTRGARAAIAIPHDRGSTS